MGPTRKPLGKVGAAIISTVVASLAIAGPVGAASDSDNITVSGESVPTITVAFTGNDLTANYAADLTPAGGGTLVEETALVDAVGVSDGACFLWDSQMTVTSNEIYSVAVDPTLAEDDLYHQFDGTAPADYATCKGGSVITVDAVTLKTTEASTAGTAYPFWLGFDVTWTDTEGGQIISTVLAYSATTAV